MVNLLQVFVASRTAREIALTVPLTVPESQQILSTRKGLVCAIAPVDEYL